MIILYHGSNVAIKEVDLKKSNKGKDFGCGFYLNPNYDQALSMAHTKVVNRMNKLITMIL